MQRLNARSGQPSASRATFDIAAALRGARKTVTNPVSDQKPQPAWKALLGLAVGIGIVLLTVFAGASPTDSGTHGSGA